VLGLTVTTIGPLPPPPPLFPPPPQEVEIIAEANTSAIVDKALAFLLAEGRRANPPIAIPTAGSQSQKGDRSPRFCALGRISAVPAPAVLIATVTVCTPLVPAAIV
jgi:hypothetical protein